MQSWGVKFKKKIEEIHLQKLKSAEKTALTFGFFAGTMVFIDSYTLIVLSI